MTEHAADKGIDWKKPLFREFSEERKQAQNLRMTNNSKTHLLVQLEPVLDQRPHVREKGVRLTRGYFHRGNVVPQEHLHLGQEKLHPLLAVEEDAEEEAEKDDAMVLTGLFQTLFFTTLRCDHVIEG